MKLILADRQTNSAARSGVFRSGDDHLGQEHVPDRRLSHSARHRRRILRAEHHRRQNRRQNVRPGKKIDLTF